MLLKLFLLLFYILFLFITILYPGPYQRIRNNKYKVLTGPGDNKIVNKNIINNISSYHT